MQTTYIVVLAKEDRRMSHDLFARRGGGTAVRRLIHANPFEHERRRGRPPILSPPL